MLDLFFILRFTYLGVHTHPTPPPRLRACGPDPTGQSPRTLSEAGSGPVGTGRARVVKFSYLQTTWWHGTVVERRSLAGELSLSCARPAADE